MAEDKVLEKRFYSYLGLSFQVLDYLGVKTRSHERLIEFTTKSTVGTLVVE